MADVLVGIFERLGLPVPVTEYRAFTTRRWRLDYAWPDRKVCLEVDGGLYVRGRHSRGPGAEADMEKQAAHILDGWLYLRASPQQVASGVALTWVERALKMRANQTS